MGFPIINQRNCIFIRLLSKTFYLFSQRVTLKKPLFTRFNKKKIHNTVDFLWLVEMGRAVRLQFRLWNNVSAHGVDLIIAFIYKLRMLDE